MATTYTQTDNLGLALYGDNDPADLRDGYNSSMRKIDSTVKTTSDAIAAKANKSDVYTKAQSDAALALKANKSDVYTKAQSDAALALKANKSDVYTKSEVDLSQSEQNTIIASKADSSSVYDKAYIDSLKTRLMQMGNESNPDLSSFTGSPISYNFTRYGSRRDWYSDDNSVELMNEQWEVSPFQKGDSRYELWTDGSDGGFTPSYHKGFITFTSTGNAGTTLLRMCPLKPCVTWDIKFGEIDDGYPAVMIIGPTSGLNLSKSTYLKIRLNPNIATPTSTDAQLQVDLYKDGASTKPINLSIGGGKFDSGSTLRMQFTGRALIMFAIYSNDSYRTDSGAIQRLDFGHTFDFRRKSVLESYSLYVGAQTSSTTSGKLCQIGSVRERLTGGANSVSIRFLTYEDGTMIQKGPNLYYLAENTGGTIDDLYTGIYEFNPEIMHVKMIGAIFQQRTDTDTDVILGDDSIKAVYDRRDSTWKLISCGMEYHSQGASSRPKLYGTTKSNLLNGGIVYVTNCKALKFPPEAGYVEDIDFYFDSTKNKWRLVGNNTKSAYTFLTENNNLDSTLSIEYKGPDNTASGVRDTGNQFIVVGTKRYITAGGLNNNLYIRNDDLTLLGQVSLTGVGLSPSTTGPWCTIFPYNGGNGTDMYLVTFDRSNWGRQDTSFYDHGSLLVYKANK